MIKDSFGRQINYLRVSVTDLCNLRCQYCMPTHGLPKLAHQDILSYEELSAIIQALIDLGIDKIRITGGEPLVRRDITTLIKKIGGLGGLKDFALTTNGVLLPRFAREIKEAGIQRLNISLDTLNREKYRQLTGQDHLADVLTGIELARTLGLPIKINVVLMKDFNVPEIPAFVEFTKQAEIDVRFIELMPIGATQVWAQEQYIPNRTVLEMLPELIKESLVADPHAAAIYYRLPDAMGTIGLINPLSAKFCGACNRLRLTASGCLRFCLHSDQELDLKALLRAGQDLRAPLLQYIAAKPPFHNLEKGCFIEEQMPNIGG